MASILVHCVCELQAHILVYVSCGQRTAASVGCVMVLFSLVIVTQGIGVVSRESPSGHVVL